MKLTEGQQRNATAGATIMVAGAIVAWGATLWLGVPIILLGLLVTLASFGKETY